MNCHTTIPEILDTIVFSFVLVPTEKHTKPLDLFLTLDTTEIQLLRFFQSSSPNEVLFLTTYLPLPKSKSYTLLVFQKSSHLTFFHHQKTFFFFFNQQ
jgi:hypothetical protein